jgi:hypothetical protein
MRLAPCTALAYSFLFACGSDPGGPDLVTVTAERSLRDALGASDVDVVGVTIAPDTNKRYVLDAERGLFELGAEGATAIAGLDRMIPDERLPESAFTDVAALGDDRFAMTALNDGFLLDLDENTFQRYFCYVPGIIEDEYQEPIVQMTLSLTYDFETQLMYAQPQTFERDMNGDVLRSQIGKFSTQGGEGFGWLELDTDFVAGGLTAMGEEQLMLGRDSKLYRYDLRTAAFIDEVELEGYGIDSIEAMARDPSSGRLLIVDGRSDQLVEIELR